MSVDILALRMAFLLLPGIVAYGIVAALAPQRDRTNTVIAILVIILGLISYALIAVIGQMLPPNLARTLDIPTLPLIFRTEAFTPSTPINFVEIIYGTFVAALLGVALSVNINYSLLIRLCRLMRLTNRHGDADTWSFLFNSGSVKGWVTVRNWENNLVYDGYVEAFSAGKQDRELILSRVKIYHNITGAEIDSVPVLYLSFPKDKVALEFRSPL